MVAGLMRQPMATLPTKPVSTLATVTVARTGSMPQIYAAAMDIMPVFSAARRSAKPLTISSSVMTTVFRLAMALMTSSSASPSVRSASRHSLAGATPLMAQQRTLRATTPATVCVTTTLVRLVTSVTVLITATVCWAALRIVPRFRH